MDRTSVDWHGYWPAAPTPFGKGGELDLGAWRELLRMYLAQGVHGILVNGSTGEWFSQTDAERRTLAESAVDEVGGRVPVIIGCTTFTPRNTCELARHAKDVGASGVLTTPPPYVVPTPREVVAFYAELSRSVELPIMVYSWARGTNVEIPRDLAMELIGLDHVVALKDSTADKMQAVMTLEAVVASTRVFGTFINRLGLSLLREIGGDGNIDGGGLGARFGVGFYDALGSGDLESARSMAAEYTRLMERLIRVDWSGSFGSPISQLKAAMRMLGQPGGYSRPPLLDIDEPSALEGIRLVLTSANLLS